MHRIAVPVTPGLPMFELAIPCEVASICTGAFTLAAAGLLDGRTVTTHWMHAAESTDNTIERVAALCGFDPRTSCAFTSPALIA